MKNTNHPIKTAWQDPDTRLYEVRTVPSDEKPRIISERQLEIMIRLMPNYKWIVVSWTAAIKSNDAQLLESFTQHISEETLREMVNEKPLSAKATDDLKQSFEKGFETLTQNENEINN